MLLPLLAATAVAHAAPVGDPVPDPAVGLFRTEAVVDVEATKVADVDCTGDTGCRAWDQTNLTAVGVQLAPLRGLGVAAELGRGKVRLDEADFNAADLSLAGALRGAVPLSRVWWLRGQVRYDLVTPEDADEAGRRSSLTAGLGLAWGDTEGGFVGHLGVQRALLWDETIEPLGRGNLSIDLRPTGLLTGTAGFSFASKPLGSAWNGAPRLTTRVEARFGEHVGAGAALGLAF
ncbi:MAG: hypothetical protein H6742_10795 [Alphaproteobacteria bacterium]|nr:hypothetical protein [Alphaproteobacteria bacterium]